MIREDQEKKQKIFRETVIEDAIITHPDKLGFPGAPAIRNFRIAGSSGAVDVVLFPQTGSPFKLVLVEAKAASAQDAGSKVVGQLIMYYAGALTLGLEGVELLRKFAVDFPNEARSIPRISPQKVIKKVSDIRHPNPHCFELLAKGISLTPKEVALFVALDNEPHPVLKPTLKILRDLHGLHIGLVLVRGGSIDLISAAAG